MQNVCSYVARNWVRQQHGNDMKSIVNVSFGLCQGVIMNDQNQQFYKWTVVTCIWCGLKKNGLFAAEFFAGI